MHPDQPSEFNDSSNHRMTLRRDVLLSLGLGVATLAGFSPSTLGQETSPVRPPAPPATPESLGWDPKTNQFILPPLPYKYEDLEPHLDKQTMELHHGKHHQAYVNGLNNALKKLASLRGPDAEAGDIRNWTRELAFHGSGHFLHVLFWNCMGPKAGGTPSGTIAREIDRCFGSFKQFADQFQRAAVGVEGSGWGILALEPVSRQLLIMQAEKHQNLTAWGVQPILAVDVWEHAYYLRYQNDRKKYVGEFMNVINWNAVDQRLTRLLSAPTNPGAT